jgi:hypothetical protein
MVVQPILDEGHGAFLYIDFVGMKSALQIDAGSDEIIVLQAMLLQAGIATLFHQALLGLEMFHYVIDQVVEAVANFRSAAYANRIIQRIDATEQLLVLFVADVDVGSVVLLSPFHQRHASSSQCYFPM